MSYELFSLFIFRDPLQYFIICWKDMKEYFYSSSMQTWGFVLHVGISEKWR